ncbi:MAG: sugar phosphate isomerase/epimerase, partial [Clostridia bacterium]|nr:sugar phosphate isomerase/epimerase [Clostridia bacterium]
MRRNILNCISTIDELDVAAYNQLGLGVEIQDFTEPNLSATEIEDLVRRYKSLFQNLQQPKSLHGPFLDLRPSSPDPMIRVISQQRYIKALQIATELQADFIVFHSQINPQLNEPFLSDLNNLQSRDAWQEIIAQVPDFGGTIVIENVFEITPAMLKALLEAIALPNIKVNLDIGHSKLGTAPLAEWIRELKDYIAYIHLHS